MSVSPFVIVVASPLGEAICLINMVGFAVIGCASRAGIAIKILFLKRLSASGANSRRTKLYFLVSVVAEV